MIITSDWLLAHGATPECADLARFDAEWPDGVEVTAESLARAREIGIDTVWWAGCADLTTDVVASLASDPDEWVRAALARGHSTLSPDVVARLARDPSPWVRASLAAGRTTLSPDVVALLASDLDEGVRTALARGRTKLPPEMRSTRGTMAIAYIRATLATMATLADAVDAGQWSDDRVIVILRLSSVIEPASLTAGDCRRARLALAALDELASCHKDTP